MKVVMINLFCIVQVRSKHPVTRLMLANSSVTYTNTSAFSLYLIPLLIRRCWLPNRLSEPGYVTCSHFVSSDFFDT